jgi:hypothetical protein
MFIILQSPNTHLTNLLHFIEINSQVKKEIIFTLNPDSKSVRTFVVLSNFTNVEIYEYLNINNLWIYLNFLKILEIFSTKIIAHFVLIQFKKFF